MNVNSIGHNIQVKNINNYIARLLKLTMHILLLSFRNA